MSLSSQSSVTSLTSPKRLIFKVNRKSQSSLQRIDVDYNSPVGKCKRLSKGIPCNRDIQMATGYCLEHHKMFIEDNYLYQGKKISPKRRIFPSLGGIEKKIKIEEFEGFEVKESEELWENDGGVSESKNPIADGDEKRSPISLIKSPIESISDSAKILSISSVKSDDDVDAVPSPVCSLIVSQLETEDVTSMVEKWKDIRSDILDSEDILPEKDINKAAVNRVDNKDINKADKECEDLLDSFESLMV